MFCPHGVCLGFQLMNAVESPRTAYNILLQRFPRMPKLLIYDNACVTNLGVIWLDPHNFLVRSHGQLLSMTSLVRVLPASAYTSNMVPNI